MYFVERDGNAKLQRLCRVELFNTLKRIHMHAFTNLSKINISKCIEYVKDSVFEGCRSLKESLVKGYYSHTLMTKELSFDFGVYK